MSAQPLNLLDLTLASGLLLLNAGVSLAFGLRLERTILVAGLRMIVQLAAVGLVLKLVFEATSPWVTLAAGLFMVTVAAFEASARLERPVRGWGAQVLGGATLLATGLLATVFTSGVLIGGEPWYQARVVLPVLGMVLGNALTGVGLVLDTVIGLAARQRGEIEARLALGATRMEACEGIVARALKTGLMPILNTMAAAGVVALPGMMTGQILAGAAPLEAAKYQIMILLVIAGSTAISVTAAALGAVYLLTDTRHRLRLDRLKPAA